MLNILRPPKSAQPGDEFILERPRPDGTAERIVAIWRGRARKGQPAPKGVELGSVLAAEGWRIMPK